MNSVAENGTGSGNIAHPALRRLNTENQTLVRRLARVSHLHGVFVDCCEEGEGRGTKEWLEEERVTEFATRFIATGEGVKS